MGVCTAHCIEECKSILQIGENLFEKMFIFNNHLIEKYEFILHEMYQNCGKLIAKVNQNQLFSIFWARIIILKNIVNS